MRNRPVKRRSYLKERKGHKDYAGTEASPYREWLDARGDSKQEHEAQEPEQANPDMVAEENGLYYQAPVEDDRLDTIQKVILTLTPRQQEILRMCGNEGRTVENTAVLLGISRGTVQTTLNRIREKVNRLL